MPGDELLQRITVRPEIFGGKPMIRGERIAVEHVLAMLAAGDGTDTILLEYPTLEPEDIQACLTFAHRVVAGEALTQLERVDDDEDEVGEESSPHDPEHLIRNRLKTVAAKILLGIVLIALWTADRLIDLMLVLQAGQRRIAPTRRIAWPKGLKEQLMRRQRNLCAYCGRRYSSHYFDIDHMDPAAYGGSNEFTNLQVLCGPCNRRKGDQNDREFRRRYAGLVPVRRLTSPSRPVAQSQFDAVTRKTGASTTVRQRRRFRFITAREKIGTGSLVCGTIVFGAAYLGLDGLARIHRGRVSGQCPEAANGRSSESGIMVL